MVLRLSKPLAASPQRARGFLPTFARPAGGGEASRLAQSSSGRLSIAILPALLGLSMLAGPAAAEPTQVPPRAASRPPAAGVDRVGTKRERGPEPATRNSTKAVEPRRKRQPVAPASANEDGKSNARPANDKEAARPAPPPPAPVPSTTAPDGAPAAQAWSQAEIIEALQSCLKALGPVVAEIEAQAPLRAGDCGVAAPVALAAVGAHPRVEMAAADAELRRGRPPLPLDGGRRAAGSASCSARPSSRC